MELKAGAPFELVWRNDKLTDPPGDRPPSFSEEHRLQSRIIEVDPPVKLVFAWHDEAEVSMTLEAKGAEVLLTVIHRRLPNRANIVGVSAGWHAHLDLLADILNDRKPDPFWGELARLRAEYDQRVPADHDPIGLAPPTSNLTGGRPCPIQSFPAMSGSRRASRCSRRKRS